MRKRRPSKATDRQDSPNRGNRQRSDKPFKTSAKRSSKRFDNEEGGDDRRKSGGSRSERPFKSSAKRTSNRFENTGDGDRRRSSGGSSRSEGSFKSSSKRTSNRYEDKNDGDRRRSFGGSSRSEGPFKSSSKRTSNRYEDKNDGDRRRSSGGSSRSEGSFKSRSSGPRKSGRFNSSDEQPPKRTSRTPRSDSPFANRKNSTGSASRRSGSERSERYGSDRYSDNQKPRGNSRYSSSDKPRRDDRTNKEGNSGRSNRYSGKEEGQKGGFLSSGKRNSGTKTSFKSSKSKRFEEAEAPEQTSQIRLNRYIANSGVCSRREADELITMGLISVNGKVITELGYKVNPGDEVRHESKVLRAEKPVYILLNKPKGYLTTTTDPQERKTVMHLIGSTIKERIYPVGRLDRNTTGLLLLTNDGDLADKLMHPSYNVKKIYKVELSKPITKADFQQIQEGVQLEEGVARVDDVAIVSDDKKTVGVELHIGWNRVVRRIFEALGYEVVKLDRSVYAGLDKKELSRGQWRFLTKEEIVRLKHF